MDVTTKRQAMYNSYLRVAQFMKQTPLSFSEWMVKRGFGYSSIDKAWVRF